MSDEKKPLKISLLFFCFFYISVMKTQSSRNRFVEVLVINMIVPTPACIRASDSSSSLSLYLVSSNSCGGGVGGGDGFEIKQFSQGCLREFDFWRVNLYNGEAYTLRLKSLPRGVRQSSPEGTLYIEYVDKISQKKKKKRIAIKKKKLKADINKLFINLLWTLFLLLFLLRYFIN